MTPPSCMRVIGPRLERRRGDAELVLLDDAAVLIVGGDPDRGELRRAE